MEIAFVCGSSSLFPELYISALMQRLIFIFWFRLLVWLARLTPLPLSSLFEESLIFLSVSLPFTLLPLKTTFFSSCIYPSCTSLQRGSVAAGHRYSNCRFTTVCLCAPPMVYHIHVKYHSNRGLVCVACMHLCVEGSSFAKRLLKLL